MEDEDLEPLGLEEQLEEWIGVIAVEWSVRFPHILPENALNIVIDQDQETRSFHFSGEQHVALLSQLAAKCASLQ